MLFLILRAMAQFEKATIVTKTECELESSLWILIEPFVQNILGWIRR